MIDFEAEQPIPITDASRHFPGRPALSTVWRWALTGVRGRRLETQLCGGRRFTSKQAIQRFLRPHATEAVANSDNESVRLRRSAAAMQALAAKGV